MSQRTRLAHKLREVFREARKVGWEQLPVVHRGVYDLLPPGRQVVILGSHATARASREIVEDTFKASPVPPRSLWRDTLDLKVIDDLRKLRQTHADAVMIGWKDVAKFRATVGRVFSLHPRVQYMAVQENLRSARTAGERSIWQSVIDNPGSAPRAFRRGTGPLGLICKFCGRSFTPPRSDSPTDRCARIVCRRRADAERKRREYNSLPRVRRRKIEAVLRARTLARS